MNETEIIYGLKNNDHRVFEYVFDTFFPQVHFFATRLIDESEEARDIVIRVFQTFWNLKQNFESINNVKAFLYITTRNNCLNYLDYRHRQEQGRKEYESRLLRVKDEKTTERKVIEAELLSIIYRKVEELPERCREIFKLTYFEGLKAGEIAQRLNISTSTVTTQRSIAIKHLREVLTDENFIMLCLVFNHGWHLMHNTA